jgi:replicative DNA helicase Mcm
MRVEEPTSDEAFAFLRDELEAEVQALADGWTHKPADRALRVDWTDVDDHDPDLARGILQHPSDATDAFQDALTEWKELLAATVVRFRNLPDDKTYRVGSLRTHHLRTLVAVECEVVEVKPVRPLVVEGAFVCRRCGTTTFYPQKYGALYKPPECQGCEADKSTAAFKLDEERSDMVDFQPIVVTPLESTLEDPPAVFVYLKYDLCGSVGDEDELTVNGIYRTLPLSMQDSTRFDVFLEASDIDVEERAEADKMTESELTTLVLEETNDRMSDDGSSYGASKQAVIETIVRDHGVRQKEVQDCIDRLVDDRRVSIQAGRIIAAE